ncbi:hypothetical protein [Psychrosphaera saromensis]|uniref:Uncharacterized protein n=1 Tax=Psychrosphaera saromensis TaxID=716813 RepID=A0A2S7UTR9_9GAMM|nr:hypothetical protein [Psychrosphaera saromensis]PQJ53128.1 hypothetical protein BTO11_05265 [Psychrosphaera saromensis]
MDKIKIWSELAMNVIVKWLNEKAIPWILHLLRVTKEFVITLLFSLSPILLSGLVIATFSDDKFQDAVISNFKRGEAFLYTAAFLAPYIVNRLGEGVKGMFKEVCFYIFWAVLLSGAYVFLVIRIETLITGSLKIEDSTLSFVSYVILFFTMLIWYYSVWPLHYKTKGKVFRKNEKEMEDLNNELDKKLGV